MTVESFIAKRFVRSIRKRRRVSITSRIATVGIGLGVAALIIVLSVMNGFSGLLWERLLALSPHVTVSAINNPDVPLSSDVVAELGEVEGVTGVAAFVETQGYLFRRIPGGGASQTGVAVLGMSQSGLNKTSSLADYMWAGKLDLSIQDSTGRFAQYGLVLGSFLADKMGAVLGSTIRVGFPPSELGTGRTPPMRRYIVTGIFNTGYAEFDTGVALVSLTAAQRDLQMEGLVAGYRVRLSDPLLAEQAAPMLAEAAGDNLKASSWMVRHANLYASIQLEKWSFYLGLSLIVVIAGFNIVSILSMAVSEHRRDIGILKAMGLSERRTASVFSRTGVRIGLSGILFGTVVGVGACAVQILFEPFKLPGNVFIVNALPVELRFWDLVAITGAAVGLCYVFALIPARDAARLRPVDAIRR
jgi:lipoprotein-releasing system permease protein